MLQFFINIAAIFGAAINVVVDLLFSPYGPVIAMFILIRLLTKR